MRNAIRRAWRRRFGYWLRCPGCRRRRRFRRSGERSGHMALYQCTKCGWVIAHVRVDLRPVEQAVEEYKQWVTTEIRLERERQECEKTGLN